MASWAHQFSREVLHAVCAIGQELDRRTTRLEADANVDIFASWACKVAPAA
jgi:hypothetical protein